MFRILRFTAAEAINDENVEVVARSREAINSVDLISQLPTPETFRVLAAASNIHRLVGTTVEVYESAQDTIAKNVCTTFN